MHDSVASSTFAVVGHRFCLGSDLWKLAWRKSCVLARGHGAAGSPCCPFTSQADVQPFPPGKPHLCLLSPGCLGNSTPSPPGPAQRRTFQSCKPRAPQGREPGDTLGCATWWGTEGVCSALDPRHQGPTGHLPQPLLGILAAIRGPGIFQERSWTPGPWGGWGAGVPVALCGRGCTERGCGHCLRTRRPPAAEPRPSPAPATGRRPGSKYTCFLPREEFLFLQNGAALPDLAANPSTHANGNGHS